MSHVVETKWKMKKPTNLNRWWIQWEQEPVQGRNRPTAHGPGFTSRSRLTLWKAEHPHGASPSALPQIELLKRASPTGTSTKDRGKLVCHLKIPAGKHPLAPCPSQHLPAAPSVLSIPATDPRVLWFNPAGFNLAKAEMRGERVSEGQSHWKNAYKFVWLLFLLVFFFFLPGKNGVIWLLFLKKAFKGTFENPRPKVFQVLFQFNPYIFPWTLTTASQFLAYFSTANLNKLSLSS